MDSMGGLVLNDVLTVDAVTYGRLIGIVDVHQFVQLLKPTTGNGHDFEMTETE